MQISPNESSWHGVGVEIKLFGPEPCLRHNTVVLRRRKGVGARPPLACDTKPEVRIMQILYVQNLGFVSQMGGGMPPLPRHKTAVLCRVTPPPLLKPRSEPKWLCNMTCLPKSNYFFSASRQQPSIYADIYTYNLSI